MGDAVGSLSEREKETLRLLLAGHDAKSIARTQGLSVHTVNERLREARRKLGVSSSREAARLLADTEDPKSVGDKPLGVAPPASAVEQAEAISPRRPSYPPPVWIGGGILVMALIVAALLLVSPAKGPEKAPPAVPAALAKPALTAETAETKLARQWLEFLDRRYWDLSWDSSGEVFKSAVSKTAWASRAAEVREPLGAVTSRSLLSVTKTDALPGAPPGEYQVVQFDTTFANQPHAVETIQLLHEPSGWKVDGYFIR